MVRLLVQIIWFFQDFLLFVRSSQIYIQIFQSISQHILYVISIRVTSNTANNFRSPKKRHKYTTYAHFNVLISNQFIQISQYNFETARKYIRISLDHFETVSKRILRWIHSACTSSREQRDLTLIPAHSVCNTTEGGNGGSTAVPKAGGKEGAGQGGGRPGVTRTRCRKDEGASARGCTLGRRNRPIDSRIYLEGGMIQPGRLPRSLPPLTRDARDLREHLREDLPLFAIDPPCFLRISSTKRSLPLLGS